MCQRDEDRKDYATIDLSIKPLPLVTVPSNGRPRTNMAHCAIHEYTGDDFNIEYSRHQQLSKRSKRRGNSYFIHGYIFPVKTCVVSENKVYTRGKSYSSMRKFETSHTVNITVRTDGKNQF